MRSEGKWSRRNGWVWPPHPLQLLAWMTIITLSVVCLFFLALSFASVPVKIITSLLLGILISVVIGLTVLVTSIDPADDNVRHKVRKRPQPLFDRGAHTHVISSDYYCNICQEVVHPTSKHCRQCNKCVLDFDHHCKWLNNCIGAHSYRWFLLLVASCGLCSTVIAAVCIVHLVLYSKHTDIQIELVSGVIVSNVVWLVVIIVTLVVALIATFLNGQLLFFHMKLVHRGITTYNFMRQEEKRNVDLKLQQTQPNGWTNNAETVRPESRGKNAADSTRLYSISQEISSTSSVPKLPPIQVMDESAAPYTALRTTKGDALRATTLFQPDFETVLMANGELTLPSILVNPPDEQRAISP